MSTPMMNRPCQRRRNTEALEARLPPRYRLDATYEDGSGAADAHGAPKRPRVRYMPPLDAPSLTQVATMSGFLSKQADNEPGKWTKYFFVLKPTTYLYYYNTEHDVDPRGILDLEFLRDVRFNADCVQRSVGGSANGFRVTGQLPASFGGSVDGSQLRPVFLDAASREEASAWMEAIRRHRFSLDRYRDYEDLLATMDAADEQLTQLTDHICQHQKTSQRILRKASAYLCKLRDLEAPGDMATTNDSPSGKEAESTQDALRSINELLDEIFAEGERQRRLVEILRERENEHFQREAQLKGCEADLEIQTQRCQQLERELESVLKERRDHEHLLESRYSHVLARERDVAAREQEVTEFVKQREREMELKMNEVHKRSTELANALKKETATSNAELARQRKALEKQQKALEKKQKLIDRRVHEKPMLKTGFVAAVRKSLPSSSPKRAVSIMLHSSENREGDDSEGEGSERQEASDVKTWRSLPTETDCIERGESPIFEKEGSSIILPRLHRHDQPSVEEASCGGDSVVIGPHLEKEVGTRQLEDDPDGQESLEARFTSGGLSCGSSSRSLELVADPSVTTPPSSDEADSTPVASTEPSPRIEHSMIDRLPPEWTCKESTSYQGRVYYFNIFTGETRWDFPLDALDDEAHSDGCDGDRLSGDKHTFRLSSVEESGDRFVATRSPHVAASSVGTESVSASKAPWRHKLVATVTQFRVDGKAAAATPPRSPVDGPAQSKAERCVF